MFGAVVVCVAHTVSPFGYVVYTLCMEQRLSIITLSVKDLRISKDFYTNAFGWKPNAAPDDGSEEGIVFYQLGGIQLALYPKSELAKEFPGASSAHGNGFTLAYNTRSESEVDEAFDRFKANNVKILKSPEKVFWGGYSGYIADPDGNAWEIAYNPFTQPDLEGNFR